MGDGSAGDADYGTIGGSYARYRRPDPRIGGTITTEPSSAVPGTFRRPTERERKSRCLAESRPSSADRR